MSTTATLAQGNAVLNLILQHKLTEKQFQDLWESGLLTDILKTDVKSVDRQRVKETLHLSGYSVRVNYNLKPRQVWKKMEVDTGFSSRDPSNWPWEKRGVGNEYEYDKNDYPTYYQQPYHNGKTSSDNLLDMKDVWRHENSNKQETEVEIQLLPFASRMPFAKILRRLEARGFRMVDYWEYCAFIEQHPDLIYKIPRKAYDCKGSIVSLNVCNDGRESFFMTCSLKSHDKIDCSIRSGGLHNERKNLYDLDVEDYYAVVKIK